MPPETSYISCNDVFKIYKVADLEVVALRGLELEVERGEVIAIIGASGSGKSTLLNVLAGYDAPSAGQVHVGDYHLLNMNSKQIVEYRRREVGFVWQQTSRNLFPYLNSLENVELPMLLAGTGGRERRDRAKELLGIVGLGDRISHKPAQLSGGEQQRVAIAVALGNQPSLLLADEPTGELDTETGQEILNMLSAINRELGTTIIVVTHDPAVSQSVGRAIAMRDGKTSSEIRGQVSFDRQIGGGRKDVAEYQLVDSSGRVQIPRDMLDDLDIQRLVQVNVDDDQIRIRPSNAADSGNAGHDDRQ
jgi:predicted ABC-type transport system involved in lysophospholipase L1 biosynthesis ATPase subunit